MKDLEAQVKVQIQLTKPFKIRQGLKQGDSLAQSLFNLALDYVIRKLSVNSKGTLEHHPAQIIGYADDICLPSGNVRTTEEVYQELKEAATEIGLHINTSKTKAMVMSRSKVNTDQCLNIVEHNIELVNSFVYLGSCISDDNNELSEIQRSIILANNTYYSLLAVMKSRMVCQFVKIRLYKTLIRTVLTYGCEAWKLSKKKQKTF
jgi:hypothetical protein